MNREKPVPPDLAAAMAAGNWREALRIAAKYRALGPHKDAIVRGWTAIREPDFYRAIGREPEALVAEGVAALRARFAA